MSAGRRDLHGEPHRDGSGRARRIGAPGGNTRRGRSAVPAPSAAARHSAATADGPIRGTATIPAAARTCSARSRSRQGPGRTISGSTGRASGAPHQASGSRAAWRVTGCAV